MKGRFQPPQGAGVHRAASDESVCEQGDKARGGAVRMGSTGLGARGNEDKEGAPACGGLPGAFVMNTQLQASDQTSCLRDGTVHTVLAACDLTPAASKLMHPAASIAYARAALQRSAQSQHCAHSAPQPPNSISRAPRGRRRIQKAGVAPPARGAPAPRAAVPTRVRVCSRAPPAF